MVVGGYGDNDWIDDVELISLDPVNHPVPECLRRLRNFPAAISAGGGAALKDGS